MSQRNIRKNFNLQNGFSLHYEEHYGSPYTLTCSYLLVPIKEPLFNAGRPMIRGSKNSQVSDY